MLRVVGTRVFVALVTLWGVSLVTFFGVEALPGDPAYAILGIDATPASYAALREAMELDRPAMERYGKWISSFVRGDFGDSYATGHPTPIWPIIKPRIGYTLTLAAITMIALVPISVALGVTSAVRREGVLDNVVTSSTLTLLAVPEFVIGTLFIVLFAVWAGWLPALSLIAPSTPVFFQPSILVLPVLTLLTTGVAVTVRMVRACVIDVLRTDYIEMTILKGVPQRRMLMRHALPNALGPTLQILALQAAALVGGIVIVETVFQYPGLGSYLVGSVAAQDVQPVLVITMLIACVYVGLNIAANLSVVLLNPRLRRQR